MDDSGSTDQADVNLVDQAAVNLADQAHGSDDPVTVNATDHVVIDVRDGLDVEAQIGARTESTLAPRRVGQIGALTQSNLARGSVGPIGARTQSILARGSVGPIGARAETDLARGVGRVEGPIGARTETNLARGVVRVEGPIGARTETNLARRRVGRFEPPIGESNLGRRFVGVDAPIGAQVPIGEARGGRNLSRSVGDVNDQIRAQNPIGEARGESNLARIVRSPAVASITKFSKKVLTEAASGLIVHGALSMLPSEKPDVNVGGSSSDTGESSETGYKCSDPNHSAVYDDLEKLALHDRDVHSKKFSNRKLSLGRNLLMVPPLPLVTHMVFFDISIINRDAFNHVSVVGSLGRIVIGLFAEDVPEVATIFLLRCRGNDYERSIFHHAKDDFLVVGGGFLDINGLFYTNSWQALPAYYPETPVDYVCEWPFRRWNYNLSHDRPGVVSMEEGRLRTDSQFFIFTDEAPQWDKRHVVVGQVLEGMDIVMQIKSGWILLEEDRDTNGLRREIVFISKCGEFPYVEPRKACSQLPSSEPREACSLS